MFIFYQRIFRCIYVRGWFSDACYHVSVYVFMYSNIKVELRQQKALKTYKTEEKRPGALWASDN